MRITKNFLEVNHVCAGYREGVDVLHDVTLSLREGEIVSIVGPNGSGKTTLLKTIIGILNCSNGDIYFKGGKINGCSPSENLRKGIAYVPQAYNIFPSLTVLENLEMGAFIRKVDYANTLDEVFKIFPELKKFKTKRAGLLSGGEQKMVAIGRALMVEPQLLVLDEPFARLSPLLVKRICNQLKKINDNGTAILIVEQNIALVLGISERTYLLRMGRVRYEGSSKKLWKEGKWTDLLFGTG